MSAETSTWLNTNTLIGFTEKRGHAWHYRAEEQGEQSNHYPSSIPADDVRERLFSWEPVVTDVQGVAITADGVTTFNDPTSKSFWHPVTGERFGTFKNGMQVHGYSAWLIDNVATIVGGSESQLQIGSAGLLKGGAIAWVQFEMPDTVETPEGVAHRPFISAATSLNGRLSSTYLTGTQVFVCDNTMTAGLASAFSRIRIRHSANSLGRVEEVRDALGLVVAAADDTSAAIAALCQQEVTDAQWAAFLDAHDATTLVDKKGDAKTGRGLTNAERVRDELNSLQANDLRCSPWAGTAFGVVQTVNTWAHHVQGVRGQATKGERNQLRVVMGEVDKLDLGTLDTLNKVLVSA